MKSMTIHVAATGPLFSAAGSRLRVGAHAAMSDAKTYVFVTKSIALATTPATRPPATTLPRLIDAITSSFVLTTGGLRALGGDAFFKRRLRIVEHLRPRRRSGIEQRMWPLVRLHPFDLSGEEHLGMSGHVDVRFEHLQLAEGRQRIVHERREALVAHELHAAVRSAASEDRNRISFSCVRYAGRPNGAAGRVPGCPDGAQRRS